MHDIIYVNPGLSLPINQENDEIITQKSPMFETVKSKVIISLSETVKLSVSISPRNLHNSLKWIKGNKDYAKLS